MKFLICPLLALFTIPVLAQPDSAYYYYRKAITAQEAKDTASFYHQIVKAHSFHPYHPTILYQAGVASALNRKYDEALHYLKKVTQLKANVDLERAEFNPLKTNSQYAEIKQTQADLLKPIIQSDTAFVIRNRTLHIESISKGATPNTFYCGSIHRRKIISVDNTGKYSDFTSSGQDGLTSVFGVKVDKKNNILWACSSPMQEMENFDSTARSAVFRYDIKSKKLLAKYLPEGNRDFIFGDLTLDHSGNVFISDSKNNIIFKIDRSSDKLEEFFTSKEFWNLQGITVTPDNKYLFISDYISGIYKLELASKKLIRLKENFDLSTKSIDGLSFYNNSLIAIQNFIYPMRVTQYFLNSDQDALTEYKIIDKAHPAFNEPTIGFVDGNDFYYVANSLWSGYTDDHKLKPEDQLQDVVILKSDLRKIK